MNKLKPIPMPDADPGTPEFMEAMNAAVKVFSDELDVRVGEMKPETTEELDAIALQIASEIQMKIEIHGSTVDGNGRTSSVH